MTSEEALALVMSKYGKVEAASRKRKTILKNLQAQNKLAKMHSDYDVEEDSSNVGDHLQVEIGNFHSVKIYGFFCYLDFLREINCGEFRIWKCTILRQFDFT